MTVSADELETWRMQFAAHEAALRALIVIEDCEGELEDAAIALALRVGQEPTTSGDWLEGFAKRWRVQVCQSEVRSLLHDNALPDALEALTAATEVPTSLAVPLLMYLQKVGMADFCAPLKEKL